MKPFKFIFQNKIQRVVSVLVAFAILLSAIFTGVSPALFLAKANSETDSYVLRVEPNATGWPFFGQWVSLKEGNTYIYSNCYLPNTQINQFVYKNDNEVQITNFEVVYGVERYVGDYQQISGDSFSFLQKEEGQFVASLSDGMGTGLNAYQESERVVDLLEQFLEAGFSKETAVKMINSALVLRDQGKTFSTIDISSIDLYSGVCEFLKIGAATSFIRRGNWVECITSTSLPAGIFQQTDLDKTCRKLYDGDMVIMVTDGVLDVLPTEHQEHVMKDIILEHETNNPKELADYILNRVLQYKNGRFCDDMTILVMGIWKR